jgi:hypothetical protein
MSLKASLSLWRRRLAYRQKKVDTVRASAKKKHPGSKRVVVTGPEAKRIRKWERLRDEAKKMVELREKQIKAHRPLREKALSEMLKLVGIMEQGGNNMGREVLKIIRANGGNGPEPWCGDTVAYAYRRAGSKVVQRGWAAVRLLGFLTGMRIVTLPAPGDIVVYNFDHTGVFRRWLGGGFFEAVEGNTGRSGAVSDSATGGDGVYIKKRHISQVTRWVRVTR